jgi:hypothetical protein
MKRLLSPSLLAKNKLLLTHDLGDRISRTVRPPLSKKADAVAKVRGMHEKDLGVPHAPFALARTACSWRPT